MRGSVNEYDVTPDIDISRINNKHQIKRKHQIDMYDNVKVRSFTNYQSQL